jgi:ferritin-like metal-binding protein YciE
MSQETKDTHKIIADWVGDIVALEGHVEEALDHQLEIKAQTTEIKDAIQHLHDTVRDSKKRAVAYQEQYGTTGGNPVVKTGAELLGKAAGLIDKLRNDTAAKALRDDYTAFNHVAIAYTMLHTTAMALGDSATESFAEEGLRTYARLIQKINHIMPVVVVEDLKANGEYPSVNASIVDQCRATIDGIWKETS